MTLGRDCFLALKDFISLFIEERGIGAEGFWALRGALGAPGRKRPGWLPAPWRGLFLIVCGTVAWCSSQRRRSPLVEGDDGVYLGQAAEEWGRSCVGRAGHHRKCFCEDGLSYSSKNVLGERVRGDRERLSGLSLASSNPW